MENRQLKFVLIGLIKKDLINNKMISELANLEIDTKRYELRIDEIAFQFFNILHRPDVLTIANEYIEKAKQIFQLDLGRDIKEINNLAKSLYSLLNYYSQQQINWDLPADTQELINKGMVTYRGCGIDGRNGGLFRLKIHGKEYRITSETMNSFQKEGQKIPFSAPFRNR